MEDVTAANSPPSVARAGLAPRHAARTVSRRLSPRWLLLVVGAGIFFGTLDQTVVVTVLPDIIKSIRLPINTEFGRAAWIVNGYLLGYTVAMPLVGRIADVYGRVTLFVICLAIFALGSVFVALSPNLGTLVAARAFQAIGGGGLLPIALAIGADVTGKHRTLVLGAMAAANNGSTFLGPVWGAAIAAVADWRAIFWLNLAIVLPIALVTPLLARDRTVRAARRLDWRGGALLALGLSALTYGLTDDGANPRPVALSVLLIGGGLALLALFIWVEWRSDAPMIDMRVLRSRQVLVAMGSYLLIGGALITALVTVPLMTTVLYNTSTTEGGLTLMRLLLLLPVGGVAGGWLAAHAGNRLTILLGLVLALAGFIWMYNWPFVASQNTPPTPPSWQLWGALGAIGLGLGFCDGPIVATVIDAVPRAQRATSSALLLVMWTTGMIVGLAFLATRGLGQFTDRIARVPLDAPDYLTRYQRALHTTFNQTFVVAAVVLLVALLLSMALRGGRAHELVVSPFEGFGDELGDEAGVGAHG